MKEIPLTKGQFAIVDDEDFIVLSNIKWHVHRNKTDNTYYAIAWINRKKILMHQFIINPPSDIIIDHKDGNGLNNCKINLRACSKNQNMANMKVHKDNVSGFKGVCPGYGGKWTAYIRLNRKGKYLGTYESKEAAAAAYDKAAIELFGEFAKTNRMIGLLN